MHIELLFLGENALVLGIASAKKLREAEQTIQELRQEIADATENFNKKRIAEATYLFSGDLTPGQRDTNADRSDLNMADYWTLQKQCYDVFKIFPYAKRIIEMMTDFVIGSELTYSVDEKCPQRDRVNRYIEDLWEDYDNNFDLMLEGMCNELWILGEQIYPITLEDTTNILKLGIVDPRMVERVMRDPKNQKRLAQVVMQSDTMGKTEFYGVVQEVKRRLDVPDSAKTLSETSGIITAPKYAGDTFLFQVNRLPTQTRGYSELATMVESLDLMDQFMFEVSERSLLLFHFIADILIKNKSDDDIKNFPVPDMRKNSTFKHSQNVELNLKTPDLKAIDASGIVSIIRKYIFAGVGIPEHWVVEGGNTNLATAREQNNPIEKRLERKQGTVNYMLKTIFRYQLEKRLKTDPEEIRQIMKAVNIDFPSVSGVDRKLRAQTLTETAKSLVIAVSQGWVTGSDAGQEYINLANKFGMELSAMHLSDADKKDLSNLTGQPIEKTNDVTSYFKSVDQIVKDQGNNITNKLVPAETK